MTQPVRLAQQAGSVRPAPHGSLTFLFCRLAALGIPLATLDTVPLLDVAIDGSDEARLPALSIRQLRLSRQPLASRRLTRT